MARITLTLNSNLKISIFLLSAFLVGPVVQNLHAESIQTLKISRTNIVHQDEEVDFNISALNADGQIVTGFDGLAKVTLTKRSGGEKFDLQFEDGIAGFSRKFSLIEVVLINIDYTDIIGATTMFRVKRNLNE